jgi:DNA-binding transcriptional MerR regulator
MRKAQSISTNADTYSAASVARITGLSSVMVNYLCRHKIVISSGSARRGRGRARQYTYADILLLRVIQKLLSQGISVLRLKKCLNTLQRNGRQSDLLTKRFVATDGVNIYFGNGAILEQLGSGQLAFAFIIELRSLRAEVANFLAEKEAA